EIKPIEPVVEIARHYKGKMPMSLGTGGRRDLAEITIRAIGLDGFFDIMVAAEDVEHHKPAPDTFLECARLMSVAPALCQVFEDGIQGLEAGKRAGMIVTDVRPFL
ncbi:MAG: HAD-IA family hydrolase, partial [Spirochaetota bacterium]